MFKSKKTKDQKTVDRSEIYTTGQLGRTREITPEGYLLCRDVPIARIGTLMYADVEVPITADNTGLIIIYRGEDVLFHPITIASAEGKPVTDDHPSDWVTPDNWKLLSKGFVRDVRRGEGADSDYLMADILVTDKETIQKVLDGKVEISLGYDADYTETSKGKGLQSNIRVNHIALVEKGRCGSRCSIGDSFMSAKKTQKKEPWYQNLLGLKRTVDQAIEEADKTVDSDDDDKTEDDDDEPEDKKSKTGDAAINREILKMLKTMDSRLVKLEKKTKDSDNPEKKTEDDDDDPENETKDDGDLTEPEPAKKIDESGTQTYTGDSLKEVISRAEILSPGYRMPTFDSANNGKAVLNTKRAVLKTAYATEDGQKAITPFVGQNPDFDNLPNHTIDAAFAGASELIKQQNNAKGIRSGIKTNDFGRAAPTPAEINKRNREFWTNQG